MREWQLHLADSWHAMSNLPLHRVRRLRHLPAALYC